MTGAVTFRPLADRLPDGRVAVYVGASTSYLDRGASLQMFVQLADALEVPIPAYLRFLQWAACLRWLPEPPAVISRFAVSRATAHRWLAAARAAQPRTTA